MCLFRLHRGCLQVQRLVLCPSHGPTVLCLRRSSAPPHRPITLISSSLLFCSEPRRLLSHLNSGLGLSFLFLQESLPFLLCPQPRMPTTLIQHHHISWLTPRRGLSNPSSVVSSNSITKKISNYSFSLMCILCIYSASMCVTTCTCPSSFLDFIYLFLFHLSQHTSCLYYSKLCLSAVWLWGSVYFWHWIQMYITSHWMYIMYCSFILSWCK